MADPTGAGSNGGTTTVVSNPPNPPTTNTVPNTTSDTKTTEFQTAANQSSTSTTPPIAVSYPSGTYLFNSQAELDAYSKNPDQYATAFVGGGYTVSPITPPAQRQEPAESVFNPGPTYNGPAATESVFDPRQDPEEHIFNPNAALPNPAVTTAAQLNDPRAGLTPDQLKALGGADPTDPYIRARLGIPQLPGSTLNVTSGFGFGNLTTGFSSIDNALGTIKNLFSGGLGSLFSKITASTTAATTGSGVAALTAPAGPAVNQASVSPASDPSQFPAYDDNGNLQPGYKINEETGQPYYAGVGPATDTQSTTLTASESAANFDGIPAGDSGPAIPQATTTQLSDAETAALFADAEAQPLVTARGISTTNLSADQADAYYNGTGTLTAQQRLEQDQQTAADAAKLYQGSPNEALKQIDIGAGNIAKNEVGIANAQKIIEANNAELADPNISDARRAELEANNVAQQDYIQAATENSVIQQNVIEQNANVYAAGGGNPGDGQSPTQVSALTDPGVTQPVDPTTLEGFGVQAPVDPTTLEGYGVPPTETEINAQIEAMSPENVQPTEAENQAAVEAAIAAEATTNSAADVNPNEGGLELPPGAEPDGPPQEEPYALNPDEDQAMVDMEGGLANTTGAGASPDPNFGFNPDSEAAASEVATRNQAQAQATRQARYKQPGNTDWRVRLSLAPGAKYLYNDGNQRSILAPLRADGGTDGVIFPYTPTITTTYSANYEQYDLIHSNYRGIFYKNSRVGDIQLRGMFTAQDTTEANYLLAVIHFFRSVTKMFYGQDDERGTPPPICLLNGFGGYQFSDHPVVVSSFNYTLPNDVDYIRTTNPNNFGLNLNNRYNASGSSLPAGGALAGLYRLLNAQPGGLKKGALPTVPAPNTVAGSVTNNTPASYVPTKMEVDITLIPVQSRSQVSQQFSLKGFANGDLLKGGFW